MVEIFIRLYKILLTHINSFHTGKERGNKYNTINDSFSDSSQVSPETDLAQYYASLEIPFGADIKEAKAAWRKMMKKYHPDLYTNDTERHKTATILTQELTKAYKELERIHYTNKKRSGPRGGKEV